MTIVAKTQSKGRGQRNNPWLEDPESSLLMSLIFRPEWDLDHQAVFNAATAVAVADYLMAAHEHWHVHIKWPNDLIINDKKAGGILIENILRGSSWCYSVIGIGLNLYQTSFPNNLPNATSLWIASGKHFAWRTVMQEIRNSIFNLLEAPLDPAAIMTRYNASLYRKGQTQVFASASGLIEGFIDCVDAKGNLLLADQSGRLTAYQHGSLHWKWS